MAGMTSICRHIKVVLLKMCGNQGVKLIKPNSLMRPKLQQVMIWHPLNPGCRKILLLYDTGGHGNKNLECDIPTDDFYMMGFCGLGSLGEKHSKNLSKNCLRQQQGWN